MTDKWSYKKGVAWHHRTHRKWSKNIVSGNLEIRSHASSNSCFKCQCHSQQACGWTMCDPAAWIGGNHPLIAKTIIFMWSGLLVHCDHTERWNALVHLEGGTFACNPLSIYNTYSTWKIFISPEARLWAGQDTSKRVVSVINIYL